MNKIQRSVTLMGDANKPPLKGIIELQTFDKADRVRRAFKALGLFWGLALISVFLPAAHFILVPLFLVLGPVLFRKNMNKTGQILSGEGPCPFCQQILKIQPGTAIFPSEETCSHCHRNVKVLLSDETAIHQ